MKDLIKLYLLSIFLLFFTQTGISHVLPKDSNPKVGAIVNEPPKKVKIWFDGEIKSSVSKIKVMTDDSLEVDKKNSHVDKKNIELLEVDLKDIQPGKYHVYWIAFAKDGHRSEGDYFFVYELKKTSEQ